jgi:hypothetical protein
MLSEGPIKDWKDLNNIPDMEEYWYHKTLDHLKNKHNIKLYERLFDKIDYQLVFKTNRYDLSWSGYLMNDLKTACNSILEKLSNIIREYDLKDGNSTITSGGFVSYITNNRNIIGVGWFGKDYDELFNLNKINKYKQYECNFYLNLRKDKLKKILKLDKYANGND